VTAILTLLILVTVIIQLRGDKNVDDNFKPVVQDELLEIPVDDVKGEHIPKIKSNQILTKSRETHKNACRGLGYS